MQSQSKKQRFKNLSISKKIFLGYGLILIFTIIFVGYTINAFSVVQKASEQHNRITSTRRLARSLDVNVLRIIIALQYYTDTKDPVYITEIETNRQEAAKMREEIHKTTADPAVISELAKYEAILSARREAADRLIAAIDTNAPAATVQTAKDERRELDDQARVHLREIIRLQEAAGVVSTAQYNATIDRIQRNVVLLIIPLVAFMIIFGVILVRSITRPLKALGLITKRIGQGDFSPSHRYAGNDEIGKLEESVAEMSDSLAKLDKTKGEFISLVSHQLRTPATAVKQSLGIIADGYVSDKSEVEKFIKSAYDSNEEQLQIIDDILSVARIDAGKLELKKETFELGKIAETAVNQLMESAKEKGHTLTLNKPQEDVTITGDKLKITMIIENLISNAIKYTPEKGKIDVSLESQADHIVVKVCDNGIGISDDSKAQLFTKFGRIQNEDTARIQGTGLGLYLVKQFITMHKGTVDVDSTPGKGTCFIVKLPKEGA